MQPGQFAWQVFDAKIIPMLRDEYRIKRVTKVRADTLEELAAKLEDVNATKALETIKAYNEAVMTEVPFDPNVKDGRGTRGPGDPQVQLGQHHRYAAVRGLRGYLRAHLHLRRPQDRHRPPACSTRKAQSFPGCTRRASWSAACSISTIRAARA